MRVIGSNTVTYTLDARFENRVSTLLDQTFCYLPVKLDSGNITSRSAVVQSYESSPADCAGAICSDMGSNWPLDCASPQSRTMQPDQTWSLYKAVRRALLMQISLLMAAEESMDAKRLILVRYTYPVNLETGQSLTANNITNKLLIHIEKFSHGNAMHCSTSE